jgi:hypothetical protein
MLCKGELVLCFCVGAPGWIVGSFGMLAKSGFLNILSFFFGRSLWPRGERFRDVSWFLEIPTENMKN